MRKRTKIVCTIGPSSNSEEIITQMIQSGMNVARLNLSHGTHQDHATLIALIRKSADKCKEPVAILADLQGPKIRVGVLPDEGIELKPGEIIVFDTVLSEYNGTAIPIDFHKLHLFVKTGERILLNDGRSEVKIISVEGTRISAEVRVGGFITSHKGINVPDSKLDMVVLTDKDKDDIKFGVEQEVDFFAMSFVMKPQDILDVRLTIKNCEQALEKKSEQIIHVIAKIERQEAVNNIEKILEVADGIMIARGDLGIEIPAENVPLVQKKLIDMALDAGKPVIVATQMLDSMQENPRPTRAEVSDVANAVIDHTDAVMLSNESASGKYPVEAVKTMSDIIIKTEESVYDNIPLREPKGARQPIDDVISQMSRLLAEKISSKIILAASVSGETGRLISRFRPELLIAVATTTERVRRQLNLSWGVYPFILIPCRSIEELVEPSMVQLKASNIVAVNDHIVVVAGEPVGQAGHVNLLEVRDVT